MRLVNARLPVVLLVCHAAAAQIITTVAGTDFQFPTSGLAALNAPLGNPEGIGIDLSGNVYIADEFNNIVVKVTPDGTLSVVAGNGVFGFSGDGGPAVNASLAFPSGVALDAAGNLYIADTDNGLVRMVSNGIITTIAGNGDDGYTGDGGPATAAAFSIPSGIAVDSSGNLYICDTGNNVIRKVSNGIVTTVAGNGTAGYRGDGGPAASASLNGPSGIAVDVAGNLYLADVLNHVVRKVSNGIITTFAGNGTSAYTGDGGAATKASIGEPIATAVDAAGNVYIADQFYPVVRKVSEGIITTFAGNGNSTFAGDGGSPTRASLTSPSGLGIDAASALYIADSERVRKVSAGTIGTIAGNGNYRFSGDGGPATSASLYFPAAVVFDSAGNLYIADTSENRIREVSNGIINTVAGNTSPLYGPDGIAVDAAGNLYIGVFASNQILKVSQGVVTPVAGTGIRGFSGDNGPAVNAEIDNPSGVAVDAAGDVYFADSGNNRIRRISDGTITTVAGNGTAGFSGDGGPSAMAALNGPVGLAFDSAGNLYIADGGNNRIRKVSNGTITTVAGNGKNGLSGDGGIATGAALSIPEGVAVDSAQNLYIADTGNELIRRVTNGIITTVAGTGVYGHTGDGGPATEASLALPEAVAVDAAGNVYVADAGTADTGSSRIREILNLPPVLNNPLAQGSTSVSATQASGGKPVMAYVSADASTTSGSGSVSVPGVAYAASVTAGSAWLSVSPQSGSTPGLITVTADPLNLTAGVYNGTIAIGVPLANPPERTVSVQFTVTAAIPPTLSLDQSHMSFTYATTSAARSQTLIVSNSGGGSLTFTTAITLNSSVSAGWLSVAPQSGTATPGNPVSLAVTADPSQLGPGTYTASLTIDGGPAGSATIPITMTITTNPLVMLLSQAGLTFTAIRNGGVIPPQTFGVLNLGSGTLNWTVRTSTLSGGNWLNATPSSGASTSASASGAPLVGVGVNPTGLAPGVYYGLVQVISAGAANTPQEVVAVLQVLPAGSDLAPIVAPTSMIFSSPAGVSSPSSQNVFVYDPTGTGKSFRSGAVTTSGGNFLVTLPTDATIAAIAPTEVVVQPEVYNLAPGTYNGNVTLQFSDGRVSTVGITFVVTNASGATSANPRAVPHDSGNCTPTKLIPVLTTLGPGFTVPASYPQGLTAQVADDCGNPLKQGQVSVEFSTGQGLKYMQSLNNGRWDVTWQTGSQQASQVILTVHATDPTQTLRGDAQINGALGSPQPAPQVSDGGVVSAATFVAMPLSPGGIISVFGSQLSDATGSAPVLPLSTQLNNTTVFLGNSQLPLFFTSAGQVNAAVPYETTVNTNLQLLVQRDNTYATPVYVDIAATQPGVLQYGQMQAIAVDVNGNLIGPSNPAHAGDVLTMYCLGLGAVTPMVADGAAAPSNPPASTVNPVTVTVGTQTANVFFAGLTPTLAGLYQIDFYVPQGTSTGDQVPVTLSTGGQTSAAVNLSVR